MAQGYVVGRRPLRQAAADPAARAARLSPATDAERMVQDAFAAPLPFHQRKAVVGGHFHNAEKTAKPLWRNSHSSILLLAASSGSSEFPRRSGLVRAASPKKNSVTRGTKESQMKLYVASAVALTALIAGTCAVRADNLETLESMHMTAPVDWPTVPQTGPKADAVKEILKKITLPPGFHIDLYALVPDARHMAVGPQGVVTFVGTRKNKNLGGHRPLAERVAEEVKEFAPTLPKKLPNGPCFSKDGFLYVVEQIVLVQYPAAEFFYESPDVAVGVVVPEGELIPKSEESFNHTARECRVGPDGKLYVQLGQPYNVPPKEKMDMYRKLGIGGIIRMDQDGKNRETYAIGMRNPVGMDFNPKDKTLWSNDNQVDGMGDDIPPGEINRVDKMGENFGFPWYGGGHTRTNEYKDETPPADIVFPGGRAGRPRGGPRADVLHRRHVP